MGCVAGQYNIIADQGATFSRNLHWEDSSGNPINITDYTARMQVRERFVSATTVLSLTSPTQIVLGGGSGTIVVTVSATSMASVAAGDYVYDLEMVASNGVVTRLLQGSFKVRPEVTR
jgi:hypothetical protein